MVRSNAETEYRAFALTNFELLWLELLLFELHINYISLNLLCDNISEIMLSHNHTLHTKTNYIELDIQRVCERVVAANSKFNMYLT